MPATIEPIGGNIEISYSDIREMYVKGSQDDNSRPPLPAWSVRSNCGDWLIRQLLNPLTGTIPPSQVAEKSQSELNRLSEIGASVISFAHVPSDKDRIIYTISPFLDDTIKVDWDMFDASIAPYLREYYKDVISSSDMGDISRFYLKEIAIPGQWSTSLLHREPFLHDVDPYISNKLRIIKYSMRDMLSVPS